MKILVTGGAGFIGSNVVRHLVRRHGHVVLNVDALTYAGHLASLADMADDPRHRFVRADIRDAAAMHRLFDEFAPDQVVHLAAESHVDRSIAAPAIFIETNVTGTLNLLQAARARYEKLSGEARDRFRFLHVSTDEVYGTLGDEGLFTESSPYAPRSPYSASKAAADHLVRAWHVTYGLPVIVTNCSNNHGPCQFPEKLIPRAILAALADEPIPVYGDGSQIRDWLHVVDHAEALHAVLTRGRVGETYNIGGDNEWRNLDLVRLLCDILDQLRPRSDGRPHADRITFVTDRPGHDYRYGIDADKIHHELGWTPRRDHVEAFRETVRWYLDHPDWIAAIGARSSQLLANS